ncbi:MAG: hypothetical protein MO852_09045 [Candidatus Devosia euplotis]|nr:hypothetical protein [Candidatus Devosia euplotis]
MSATAFKSEQAAAAVEAHYRRVLQHWPGTQNPDAFADPSGADIRRGLRPPDAPPVLLLHGSQANADAWIPDVALWSTKFRLYAVDMIGEAGLFLAGASIVGNSLGGWPALDYASRRPQAVRVLALISPAGIGRQKNFLLKALPLLLGPWGSSAKCANWFSASHRGICPKNFPSSPR